MDKVDVATVLEDIAAMMELKGENPFKIRAYANGARALLSSPEDIQALVAENRLTEIKGIGKGLSENITILVKTGKLPIYEELRKSLHPGLLEITRIQGLGPKKAMVLYEKLGIKDVPGLKKAAEGDKIAKLKGFGEATQKNILTSIKFHADHAAEHLLSDAQDSAALVIDQMKKLPQIKRISACGSLRRHKETVHDVDILISADQGAPEIMETFVKLPGVMRVLGHGETKSSVLLHDGMQIDLRVVTETQFPFALHYFTGNKDHNIVMRQRAQTLGYKLNEYGLTNLSSVVSGDDDLSKSKHDGKTISGMTTMKCKDEEALFHLLGLAYIPPELREDRGEFEAAENGRLPKLIDVKDIQGVFHVHSTWSDGTVELEGMIQEAQDMGFAYVGISDHSQVAAYAGGLTPERVRDQGKVIEQLRKKFKIRIFWGTECDVLKDGRMDYADDILKHYDFVIASVHSFFKLSEREMTTRVLKAIRNKYVTILGHITGRLLLRRQPYALNVEDVLKVAGAEGVAVEINALPDRMELDWRMMPRAKALGCRFSVNPDAHSRKDLRGYHRGVGIARKGWLTKEDVVNTLAVDKMSAWLKTRR